MQEPLIHYSVAPLTAVHSVKQDGPQLAVGKPNGLWFSAGDGEDGWRAWCESEMPSWIKDRVATELVLTNNANMLRITDADDLDIFSVKYRTVEFNTINWRRVAIEYQGIIIAPYIWSRRLGSGASWYYGWDCASGCIWDSGAVASLKQMTA